MRVGIVARPEVPGTAEMAEKVIKLLGKNEVLLYEELAKKIGKKGNKAEELKRADAIVAIGGDGTVLRAQRMAPDVPILGINMGLRGFLAEVEKPEVEKAVGMLTEGKLSAAKRERLKVTVGGKKLPDALNDVVVATANLGKTISLTVKIDGGSAVDVVGDGVIVSTPTGSTAYARAAGGSIIDPDLGSIQVVPVCPSNRTASSIVLPPNKKVEIGIKMEGRDAVVIVDGIENAKIGFGEKVTVAMSDHPATFFVWKEFYGKLREKIL